MRFEDGLRCERPLFGIIQCAIFYLIGIESFGKIAKAKDINEFNGESKRASGYVSLWNGKKS
jgi:hypothetical protein